MRDPMYLEEERQLQMKAKKEKRLAREFEEQRRRETPGTWEHYFAKQEEANRRAREADARGTTSETWPPARSPPGIFPLLFFQNLTINYNSWLNGSHWCICYILLVVVFIDELDIDSINRFEKTMPGLHPKLESGELECYCGDICKMQVSGDCKTLWQRFWMCNNLAYDLELGNTDVRNNRLCCVVSFQVLNEF
jgi:hypothetical protein